MIGKRYAENMDVFKLLKTNAVNRGLNYQQILNVIPSLNNKLNCNELVLIKKHNCLSLKYIHQVSVDEFKYADIVTPEMFINQGHYQTLSFTGDNDNLFYIMSLCALKDLYEHEHLGKPLENFMELNTEKLMQVQNDGVFDLYDETIDFNDLNLFLPVNGRIVLDTHKYHYALRQNDQDFCVIDEDGGVVLNKNKKPFVVKEPLIKLVGEV